MQEAEAGRQSLEWKDFAPETQEMATTINDARVQNRQLQQSLSQRYPELDQPKAYRIAAAIRALRTKSHGKPAEKVVGRKIGFSNKAIWPTYNIDASNWSYVYDSTMVDLVELASSQSSSLVLVDISGFSNLEPKIEPEIVLGLCKRPNSGMGDLELLESLEWVAHGYEIVQSIFPGWQFEAADTTAAFALHGRLLVGPKVPLSKLVREDSRDLLEQLRNFTIRLSRNDEVVDEGKGSNVLGSPINALRHLCELLEADTWNEPLQEREVVTTGTLTGAWSIRHGDVWSTDLQGLGLPGLNVKFMLKGAGC